MNAAIKNLNEFYKVTMSREEFLQLSAYIQQEVGIKMPEVKKTMLQSRLQKRLRQLNILSFKEYIDYVFKEGNEQEVINMIDVVSTNKTDFFREPVHFNYLSDEVLPAFVSRDTNKNLKVWSAGCSSGEEVYTLAITLEEFFANYPGFDYSILGTDISTDILNKAVNAVYKMDKVDLVPLALKKKYMLKSKDQVNPTVKIVKTLREKARFRRLNFMDSYYDIKDMYDIIFCRNVLIYFERNNQERVINKLCENLKTGGYFFLGHSESIMNMDVPLRQIRPTIFQKI